jgi:DNA helicase HerA-like ATPase
LAVIGRTGSGKTHAAIWHLSQRSFDEIPWIVFDYKGDDFIASIPGMVEIDYHKPPPTKPGLYVVRPIPDDVEAVEAFLWGIWENGNTGVYIDEGYMVGRYNKPFRAILTQGRSKNIPVIVLSQRPAWLDPFVWSEADFYQIFQLNQKSDRKRVREFVPDSLNLDADVRAYHSHYYDVGKNTYSLLLPMPERDKILEIYKSRMAKRRRKI